MWCSACLRIPPSFPTRRSSDLGGVKWTYTYTANNDIDLETDPLTRQTDYIYDSRSMSLLAVRSEEHTSELQSRGHLVCRPLLEKKNSTSPSAMARTGPASALTR